jgi:hypothetical protein
MDRSQGKEVPNCMPISIEIDLNNLDLNKLASMEGTALHTIVQELSEDASDGGQAKHHSHHSYNTHGTAAW